MRKYVVLDYYENILGHIYGPFMNKSLANLYMRKLANACADEHNGRQFLETFFEGIMIDLDLKWYLEIKSIMPKELPFQTNSNGKLNTHRYFRDN